MSVADVTLALDADTLSTADRAIARSVLYAALFDYPLTLAQLRQTLVQVELTATDILSTYAGSPALQALVDTEQGYFFPRGRAHLIDARRRREARSRAFLGQHRLVLTVLGALPYVRMVALSGSLAHLNLDRRGDLDLFLIVRAGRVWLLTVVAIILAKLCRRRHTVCLNFIVADTALEMTPRDVFTANQIVSLRPLVGADVYRQFVRANPWVFDLYRNFHPTALPTAIQLAAPPRLVRRAAEVLLTPLSALLEPLCRWAYRTYLRRRAHTWTSPDQVRLDDDCVKLHTHSHRQSVLNRYGEAVATLAP